MKYNRCLAFISSTFNPTPDKQNDKVGIIIEKSKNVKEGNHGKAQMITALIEIEVNTLINDFNHICHPNKECDKNPLNNHSKP